MIFLAFFDDVKKKTAQFAETAIDKTGEMAQDLRNEVTHDKLKIRTEDVYNQLGTLLFQFN